MRVQAPRRWAASVESVPTHKSARWGYRIQGVHHSRQAVLVSCECSRSSNFSSLVCRGKQGHCRALHLRTPLRWDSSTDEIQAEIAGLYGSGLARGVIFR
jgi:hypothetical protein